MRSDEDSDGFAETVRVTVASTVTGDPNEVAVFYPAKDGEDAWEVRPINVSFSGNNIVITFKIWQIVAANKMAVFNPDPLDAEVDASYESTVDVYRVYNDPSTQAQFLWENLDGAGCGSCLACRFGSQAGCFHLRDARLGISVPTPGSWNSETENFDSTMWTACREPDQVKFWYYSGYEDKRLARSKVEMAQFWEYAVAFYAASKLDRNVCGCSNVQQFIDKWRVDTMTNEYEGVSINITPEMLGNKLGTTMGALYAYKRIHQNGMRIIK